MNLIECVFGILLLLIGGKLVLVIVFVECF